MSWFNNVATLVNGLVKSDVVRDMILNAKCDIYTQHTDRDNGYTEVKFANEDDELRVLGEDLDSPIGGFRVMNLDNNEQIATVQFEDLDDGLS